MPIHKSHGFTLYGNLKYPEGFSHFDYVNPAAPKGGHIRLMATGNFDTLNPYTMKGISPFNTPGTFIYGIGEYNETLLQGSTSPGRSGDEPYSAYGLIAETIEYPEDKSWVIFNIRKEATFHDGVTITSKDVAFSYETLKTKGHPRYAILLQDVKSVEVLTPKKLKVSFQTNSSGSAILRFGEIPILPAHYWKDKDFEKTTLTPPLLSGPYKISNLDPGQYVTFTRVEDYWGRDLAINRGRYNFDKVTIDFYRDLTIAFEAFKGGEFDIYIEYMSKNWAKGYNLPAISTGKIIKSEIPHRIPSGTQGFFFNSRKPIFSDIRVRKALSSVFDFSWSNSNLFYGAYKRSSTHYPNSPYQAQNLAEGKELALLLPFKSQLPVSIFDEPIPLEVHRPDTKVTRETFKKAFELLAEAGWTIQEGKLVDKEGHLFEFEFLIRQKGLERILQPYAKNLEKLGIKATLRLIDASQYKNRLDNFDFDATTYVLSQGLAPGQEQQDYFHSKNANTNGSKNYGGVNHPVVDSLTEMLLSAKSPDELIVTMRALDRVLLSLHYIVPNWHIDHHRIAYQNKFGIPNNQPDFSLGFENWWIKPSR